jgi:hypothetical protein
MNLSEINLACKIKNWNIEPVKNSEKIRFSTNGKTWNYFLSYKGCGGKLKFIFTKNRDGSINRTFKRRKKVEDLINKVVDHHNSIMRGETCYYCGKKTSKGDSSNFYGPDYTGRLIYYCKPCDAVVGTHGNSSKSLGFVAKQDLRKLRNELHSHFDKIWQACVYRGGLKSNCRTKAYKWLSYVMDIETKYMHIGMLNKDQCKKALELVKEYSNHL